MDVFQTKIDFTCPSCGQTSDIEVPLPELNLSYSNPADYASEGLVWFCCPNLQCNEEFDGYALCTVSECTIHLYADDLGCIVLEIKGNPPFYSQVYDWDELEIPDNPGEIFISTHDQLMKLLDIKFVLPDDDQIVARMIFTQIFSAMEAFLADTLMSQVLGDKSKTIALLAKDKNIGKQRFCLKDIAKNDKIVYFRVKEYLQNILYHDLVKVRALYKNALGIELKVNDKDWEHLDKAKLHRHDCVHRNGFKKDDTKNTVFTKDYVQETAIIVKRLVDTVDAQSSPLIDKGYSAQNNDNYSPSNKKIEELRKTHPNAYKAWSPQDDEKLQGLVVMKKSNLEISNVLGRRPSAIRSRKDKLAL